MSEEIVIDAPKPRIAAWLTEPMRRNRATYLKVAAAAVMINLFGLVTSLFAMTVYDSVLPNNATASLVGLSIGLGIVVLFDFLLKTLRAYFVDIAGADIDRRVGTSIFNRLLSMRMDMRKGSTGSLAGLMRELETLRDFFASATMTAIVDVPFVLLTLAVIALIGGKVVLVPLAMVPIVLIAGLLTRPAMDRLSAQSMGEGLAKQSVLVEAIGGLETVKSVQAGPLLTKRWRRAMESHADSSLRQRLVGAISVNIATSGQTISYAGVVIVGVAMIGAQELTMGGLIACSMLAGRAVAPLAQIASLLSRLTSTQAAYRQLDGMMQAPREGAQSNPLVLAKVKGAIEFRRVTFRYPGATANALEDVSFSIKPGERVAILGRIGSGKSTVARLILGLYPPADGLVMMDGTDLRQLDIGAMRAQMGVALQESVLLSGSVRDNITLGRDGVDDEEMLRAANLTGTHQFMGQIANGYDLRLNDRGESLSGGQRQSIAIARALAGRPPVLIFDEPTSAMDTQTESSLLERLHAELTDQTLVVITHRPSLVKLVTRLIVMDAGKIIADGPRDEVLKKLQPRAAA
ncbi:MULTISPECIES: type I secretion system permease/ATPase [Sphingomonas]|uniref:ATP-binding cassette subfamily C protein LapB n=2 Tax=Sphingomonas TaxID=13687 RepID=A0A7W9F1K4_9SPHN|nr:type I secretion system permease/ATPase [Sphingomonas prati]MBB5729361.1 ATP-binding cassette subfamily C protein LapB [Sphingomonas prati]GGE78101.1 hypothetical protein GCM10011404_08420 [Sphingomonas prati]